MRLLLILCCLLMPVPALAQLTLLTLEPGVVGQSAGWSATWGPYPMTGYGTYTGTAPSNATGAWTGCGGGSATVTAFTLNPYPVANTGGASGATGTFLVQVNAPGTAGTCTLTITTNLSTSATSPSTTVASYPSGGTVSSNIHNAPGWLHSHAYTPASGPKTRVNNGAGWTESSGTWNPGSALNAYELTSGSCTSAASGGPTGTGSSISDGTCTWKYLSGTDYVSFTGWERDAPAWVGGTTYSFGQYVTTNISGNYRAYSLESFNGNSGNPAAFCQSTTAPSGVGTSGNSYSNGWQTFADGCTWTYRGTLLYSSQVSTMPFNTYANSSRVSHLSRNYTALLWNDQEYVAGSNGETSPILMIDHQGGGFCCGSEGGAHLCVGPTMQTDCPLITVKPADGEGFATGFTPSIPLTGFDPTKGVAIAYLGATLNLGFSNGPYGFGEGDWNIATLGLQIKSTASDGLVAFNSEIAVGNIVDGGFPGQGFQSAIWMDVPAIVANNLIITHGPQGLAFKYGSSVALFNTIANAGSITNAVCISYQWAWVWTSLIAANNACYNFPHFGSWSTGEGVSSVGYLGIFDASSGNNVTDTASPDGNQRTVTFTNGSANIGWPTNTLTAGTQVYLKTTGTLPTNFTRATPYFVIATGLSSSNAQISATLGGSAIVAGSAGSGVQSGYSADNVPNGGNSNGGTVMMVPNSTYGATGSAMFVSPGSDWRPGPALIGAGASYGSFSWGCFIGAPGCTNGTYNFDTPDFLGTARPQSSSWTVGAEQLLGAPPPPSVLRLRWMGHP